MSKMPSKKKSCFQITSVTQAQVAANNNTDDTESLDDPDDSTRTEDVSSSEMYDMSKGGDFEPETCDVSLTDEPQHNEVETSDGAVTTIPASRNNNTSAVHVNPNVRALSGAAVGQTSPASASSQPSTSSVSSSATVSSCSSRFRVIKLDHGTGEPFKRGRWTCTEFYERDTDASSTSRTVESAKHGGPTDHSVDKDGQAGAGGSVAAHEPHTDSGYASAPSNPPVELQPQTFGISQQGLGLVAQNLFGDAHAHAQHVKSPSMPSTTQPQPFYPGKQAQKPGQIIQTVIPSADFRPQHQPPGCTAQTISVTSLPLVTPMNQGPSPVMTPALGLVPQPVDGRGLAISQPEHVQGLLQQSGVSTALGTLSAAAVAPQAPVPLIQPAVTVSVSPHAVVPGVQNVPVVMSSASNTPQSMPKQTPVPVVPPQQNQPQGVHSGSAGLGAQATAINFSQLPTSIIPADETQRKSDVLLGKDAIKSLNPEGLQLHTPAVNSLFGITIPIDGDEDRNPSTAFYQAFPNGRSKAISDGASGASVVAIDNKIEQAMDLVKSHLMYAVREEVEVLKEQIKELYERNSVLERENAVLKSLANTEQLTQLTAQIPHPGSTSPQQTPMNAILQEGSKLVALPPQPNVSTA